MSLEPPGTSGRDFSLMGLSSQRPALPLYWLLGDGPENYIDASQDYAGHLCRELDAILSREKESNGSNDINPESFTIPDRGHAQSLGSSGFDWEPTKAAFLAGVSGLPSAGLSFRNAAMDGVKE